MDELQGEKDAEEDLLRTSEEPLKLITKTSTRISSKLDEVSIGSNKLVNLLSRESGFGKPSLLVGPGDPIGAREEQS